MLKKYSLEEKINLAKKVQSEKTTEDMFFLREHFYEGIGPMCFSEHQKWYWSKDFEKIKDCYQNYIMWGLLDCLCYNGEDDISDYTCIELIDYILNDFDQISRNLNALEELKRIIADEPKDFNELKEYIKKTENLFRKLDLDFEARIFDNWTDAFELIKEKYKDKNIIPIFEDIEGYLDDDTYF